MPPVTLMEGFHSGWEGDPVEVNKRRNRMVPNRSVQDHAWEFHKAAGVLFDNGFVGAAVIVNASFALELYLKCLNADLVFSDPSQLKAQVYLYGIVYDEPREKGHRLTPLFQALPWWLQVHLSERYSTSALTETAASLEEALALFNNVFVEWRYVFEGRASGVKVTFLFELLDFFRCAVNDLGRRAE